MFSLVVYNIKSENKYIHLQATHSTRPVNHCQWGKQRSAIATARQCLMLEQSPYHTYYEITNITKYDSVDALKSHIVFLSYFMWCHYSPAPCFTCIHFRRAWMSCFITWSTGPTPTGTRLTRCWTVVILSRQVRHLHYILVLQQTKVLNGPAERCNNCTKNASGYDEISNTIMKSSSVYIPYILESNPHPFYSFRGLKNQMWIRFAI
jgi:hypothetical protein